MVVRKFFLCELNIITTFVREMGTMYVETNVKPKNREHLVHKILSKKAESQMFLFKNMDMLSVIIWSISRLS